MALSNWDTLAFDENAKPTNGTIEGFVEGTICEIYKNWLYVSDKNMWTPDGSFCEAVIARVDHGCVTASDFAIEAVRGPQSAIFVKVTSIRYNKEGKSEARRMAGIGCSGYQDGIDLVIKEEGIDLTKWESGWSGTSSEHDKIIFTFLERFPEDPDNYKTLDVEREEAEYGCKWIGVLDSTYAKFLEWLKSDSSYSWDEEYKAWIDKIVEVKPLRANQGDIYFAKAFGTETPATGVGEQEEPIISQAFASSEEEEGV
jgi:hypothetical protein